MKMAYLCCSLILTTHALSAQTALTTARSEFQTVLIGEPSQNEPFPAPPADSAFEAVQYQAPLGPNWAYLSRPTSDRPVPAILWITGGFPVARGGEYVWTPGPEDNEQSASAYREAGDRHDVPDGSRHLRQSRIPGTLSG